MKPDRQFVTALGRGLETLRCFTPERPELGASDIARLTGLPQPTIWRLCHTLETLGYLVPGKSPGKLRPGPAILTLGSASLLRSGIAEVAYPLMKQIADRYQASVSLAERHRLNMVITQRAEADTILRLNFYIGATLAIERSALGWAYLSAVSDHEREHILAAVERQAASRSEQARRDIAAALAHYQRHGFVFNLRRYHPDVNAIGVPVVASDGKGVMVLNCGGASSVVTEKKLGGPIARDLKALAKKLSSTMAD
jgi:DNA-binding IclR family transcriptional regulator